MRTLPLYAFLSLVGHALLYRALRHAFPGAPLLRLRQLCVALSVAPPVFRAALSLGIPVNTLAAFFVLESLVVFLGGVLSLPFLAYIARKSSVKRSGRDEDEDENESRTLATPGPEPSDVSRRAVLTRALGTATYGTAASVLGWGYFRGRHDYRIEEVVVRIPGLSKQLDGYTIVQVSDIHTGEFVGERELRDGFGRIAALKPDLVVATGDLVDHDATHAPLVARMLADIQTRDGVCAILGNHDHYAGGAKVAEALRRAGVRMMVNESFVLRKSEGGILLVGVDDLVGSYFHGEGPRLHAACKDQPRDLPRILLAHQPNFIEWTNDFGALQLSGHTHGGQINPGFNAVALVQPYVAGRYTVGKTTLYVNRGFGVVGPPARINAPPEITKVILVGA